MMLKKCAVYTLIILGSFSVVYSNENNNTNMSSFIKQFLLNNTNDSKWILKVNGFNFTEKSFLSSYKYFMDKIPENKNLDKKAISKYKDSYFNTYLRHNVFLIRALNEGALDSVEAKAFIEAYMRQAVFQYYIQKRMPNEEYFLPSQEDVDDYYEENKEKLLNSGIAAKQIQKYIISFLTQKNMEAWVEKFINETIEEFKVERNKPALKKIGIE